MELDGYVSVADAAEMMGKTVNLVGKLARSGRLPGAQKIGRMGWLIPRDSVLSYRPQKQRGRTKAERLAARQERLLEG